MERELKYVIPDEAAFQRLIHNLGTAFSTDRQRNYYLDTADGAVARRFSMLRVRDEGDTPVLTFKRGICQQNGYFQAEEHEAKCSLAALQQVSTGKLPGELLELAPVKRFREYFDGVALHLQGVAENVRSRFRLACGEVAELDQTTFPGGRREFELEVETERPREVEAELDELFARADIVKTPQTRTKYARFLAALEAVRKADAVL